MALPHARLSLLALLTVSACGGGDPSGPAGGTFAVGQTVTAESGRDIRVLPGASAGDFVAVVVNAAPSGDARASYSLRGAGLGPEGASAAFQPGPALARAVTETGVAKLTRDAAFDSRLRDRERTQLTPRFEQARRWNASRVPAIPTSAGVGDLVTVNVNVNEPCERPVYHVLRVMAIGSKSLVLADTLNPKGGFSAADFQGYAARFDTLVYPLDVAAFGEPTDIDRNGRIAIVFTRAVNELTPRNAVSYVGGLTYSRDLFPQVATARTQACAASNEGEYFYLMAPDPAGTVNGNRRSIAFVDSNTTAVTAHEFVHLINASRKLYVNTSAPKFEEKWLDEGLAHVAEELLFYHDAGLTPRANLGYGSLVGTPRARAAYLRDMAGNASRYREYLDNTAAASPYAAGDSLSTRGATWSLLRFLVDQSSTPENELWARLVNSTTVGTANLQNVFNRDLPSLVRDWAVSQAVDDLAGTPGELQQRSWNWHSIFAGIAAVPNLYPLQVTSMATSTSYTGTVVAGGAAFYKLTVPANGTATLSLGGQAGAAGSNLQLVIVRTK